MSKKLTLIQNEQHPLVSIKTNTNFLLNVFTPVKHLIGEGRIVPSLEGLGLVELEGSHICLLDFWWDKTDCLSYTCDPTAVGMGDYVVDFESLVKLIKAIKVTKEKSKKVREKREKKLPPVTKRVVTQEGKNEQCELYLYDTHIKIKTETYTVRSKRKKSDELDKINVDSLLAYEFTNEFDMAIEEMKRADKSIGIMSECITMVVKNDGMYAVSELSDNSMIVKLKGDLIQKEALCYSVFAHEFMDSIFNHQTLGKKVKIQLKKESPLRMDINFGINSHYRYFLAPRIDDRLDTEEQETIDSDVDDLIASI